MESATFKAAALLMLLAEGLAAAQEPVPFVLDLTVVCRDEHGAPVAGAEVMCAPWSRAPGVRSDVLQVARTGTSDKNGRCRFKGLEGPTYYLVHARTDRVGAWGRAALDSANSPDRVDLTLGNGVTAVGFVHDPDGAPLAGVTVLYHDILPVGKTGSDGQYMLPNLTDRLPSVGFVADGYAYASEQFLLGTRGPDVSLGRGAVVEGTVFDPEGRPAAGAEISCWPFTARSDSQGHFRTGWRRVSQSPQDRPDLWDQVAASTLRDGKNLWAEGRFYLRAGSNRVDLHLRPSESYPQTVAEGTVARFGTGEPVQGKVGAYFQPRGEGGPIQSAKIQPDGRFLLEGLPEGTFYLKVHPRDPLLTGQEPLRLALVAGQRTTNVALAVEDGCALRGIILDDKGTPVPNVDVLLTTPNFDYRDERTDRDGAFAMDHLPPVEIGHSLEVCVAQGRLKVTAPPTVKGRWTEVPPVRLPAQVVLAGTVVDTEGKPVAAAEVSVEYTDNPPGTSTDTHGRFRVEFPYGERGDVGLHVWVSRMVTLKDFGASSGLGFQAGPTVEVVKGGKVPLEPGKKIEDWRVVVRITPRGSLAGTVVDEAGKRVEACVSLLGPHPEHFKSFTGNGRFFLMDTPTEPYAVEVTAAGYQAQVLRGGVDFELDDEGLQVVLREGPFAEGVAVFTQVTGLPDTPAGVEALPDGRRVNDRCKDHYPNLAKGILPQID